MRSTVRASKALEDDVSVMKRKRNEHAAGTKHETQTVIAGANTRNRRCNIRDEHTKGGISAEVSTERVPRTKR